VRAWLSGFEATEASTHAAAAMLQSPTIGQSVLRQWLHALYRAGAATKAAAAVAAALTWPSLLPAPCPEASFPRGGVDRPLALGSVSAAYVAGFGEPILTELPAVLPWAAAALRSAREAGASPHQQRRQAILDAARDGALPLGATDLIPPTEAPERGQFVSQPPRGGGPQSIAVDTAAYRGIVASSGHGAGGFRLGLSFGRDRRGVLAGENVGASVALSTAAALLPLTVPLPGDPSVSSLPAASPLPQGIAALLRRHAEDGAEPTDGAVWCVAHVPGAPLFLSAEGSRVVLLRDFGQPTRALALAVPPVATSAGNDAAFARRVAVSSRGLYAAAALGTGGMATSPTVLVVWALPPVAHTFLRRRVRRGASTSINTLAPWPAQLSTSTGAPTLQSFPLPGLFAIQPLARLSDIAFCAPGAGAPDPTVAVLGGDAGVTTRGAAVGTMALALVRCATGRCSARLELPGVPWMPQARLATFADAFGRSIVVVAASRQLVVVDLSTRVVRVSDGGAERTLAGGYAVPTDCSGTLRCVAASSALGIVAVAADCGGLWLYSTGGSGQSPGPAASDTPLPPLCRLPLGPSGCIATALAFAPAALIVGLSDGSVRALRLLS